MIPVWQVGAGTFAGGTGSRQPTPLELGLAKGQGRLFAEYIKKHWLADEPAPAASEPVVARKEEPKPVEHTTASQSSGHANAEQARQAEKESGPCGLPKSCVVL